MLIYFDFLIFYYFLIFPIFVVFGCFWWGVGGMRQGRDEHIINPHKNAIEWWFGGWKSYERANLRLNLDGQMAMEMSKL